jgi:hypothetical protein
MEDALEAASAADGVSSAPENAENAVRHLMHTDLVREVLADDGRKVIYNPNVWTQGEEVTQAALKAADAHGTKEVGALL